MPLAHSVALIAWGGIAWFDGYSKANQAGYLGNTVRWATDWLMQAHPSDSVLYVQVSEIKKNASCSATRVIFPFFGCSIGLI